MPDAGPAARLYRWFVVRGDRRAVVAAQSVVAFAVCAAVLGGYLPADPEFTPVLRLGAGLVGGLLPFVTLVLAVNQLVLSMELGSVFHLERRLDSMEEYRETVGDVVADDVAPAEGPALFESLFAALDERADDLADHDAAPVREYAGELEAATVDVAASAGGDATLFDALVAVRSFDPGPHLHRLQRVRTEHADGAAFEDVETLLERIDVGQKFFWTVYTEELLSKLSRLVLYVGLVALLAGTALVLGYPRLVAAGVDGWPLALLVSAAVTLCLLPYFVLLAYMLRVATVARTTAGFGPFVARGPGWD